MKHLQGQLLLALGASPGSFSSTAHPKRRATSSCGAEAGTAEWVDSRSSLQAMEHVHRLGLATATALFLGAFIHGFLSKTQPQTQATATVWGLMLRLLPYSTVTDLARLRG